MELDKVVESARKSAVNLNFDSYLPHSNRIALFINEGINTDNNKSTLGIHEFATSLVNDKVDALCFPKPTDYQSLMNKRGSLDCAFNDIDGVKYITSLLLAESTNANRSTINDQIIEQYVNFLKVYRPTLVIVNGSIEVFILACRVCHLLNVPFAVQLNEDEQSLSDNCEELAVFRSINDLRACLFVPDERTKEKLINSGINPKKIELEKNISDWVAEIIKESAFDNLHRYLDPSNRQKSSQIYKKTKQPSIVGQQVTNPSATQQGSIFGNLNIPENIELPKKEPLWFSVPVKEEQELIIEASCKYINVGDVNNRKAVLLINSFDAEGKQVDVPCGKMAKSGHLKAYFKYIACTDNQAKELHSFKVPKGITSLKLGVCGFNNKEGELVVLRTLRMSPKPDKSKPSLFIPPSQQAADISILGWPELPLNSKPIVMGIMDEFTTGCFEKDVNLIQPRPDNWYALAEKYRPDLFFIESAWKGNFGSWQYRVANYTNKPGDEIAHICQYAKENGIPTLFWNKEDPVHHDKFICSAKLVEHIFTTDANMKQSYTEKTGNENVHALPFAAQPMLHKPAPLNSRKPKACFAGSWYGNRHAERGEAMGWLLSAAKKHGLDIYDRNYGTGIFPFPDKYASEIKGSLPYLELCGEYNKYRVFLNVNSVTESPTMFSRRVFELMACGTPVVSTYAKGIEDLFDSDAVWLVKTEAEANEALHTLMTDDAEWRRRSLAGIREVFAKHTYAHRLNDIFDRLGIETCLTTNPKIALVANADSRHELEVLNHFAKKQSYREFQLGIACSVPSSQFTDTLSSDIKIMQPNEISSWLQSQTNDVELVGQLNSQHSYGEHFLRDLVNASLYEPNAIGWAKSMDQDRFSYNHKVSSEATLFNAAHTDMFLNTITTHFLMNEKIFVADADQFVIAHTTRPQLVGGVR